MDATRRTTDMIDRQTLADAYDAYVRGMEVGRLAARLDVYPADLKAKFDEMTAERERRAKSPRANTMGRLQDALFAELDRLDAIDITDTDALKAEVERSKAVEGIARATIENVGVAIEATRLKAQYTQNATVTMPKLLEG
ncbi:MAG: hypothetical protein IJ943_03680 [Akkermansia sp.]|nr:hypothetical protein [Akkermansia sp.]MBR3387503.1 hypothetical protein [Bacteroidales bacterium]